MPRVFKDLVETRPPSVINLSSHPLSVSETSLLSRGLSFCPESNIDIFEAITDIHLFVRKLLLKCMYNKNNTEIDTTDWSTYKMREFKALRDLTILFQENNTIDLIGQIDLDTILEDINKSTLNPISLFKKPSTKFPTSNLYPNVAIFLQATVNDICKLHIEKFCPRT